MSALDLFASAMGAFIVIAIVLFPFYLKFKDISEQVNLAEQRLGDCERKNGDLRNQIDEQGRRNAIIQAGLRGCLAKLKTTFLAIVMKWDERGDDVDMYIRDPHGNQFSYKRHNRTRRHFSGTSAKLSYDTRRGPGVEIWEHPIATQGTYVISYNFFADRGRKRPVKIRANLYTRDGVRKLREITLRRKGETRVVARVTVAADGSVRVR
jgi:hypothetical protein